MWTCIPITPDRWNHWEMGEEIKTFFGNGGVKNWSLHCHLLLNGCDLWSYRRNSGIRFLGGSTGFREPRENSWPTTQRGEFVNMFKVAMCIYLHYTLIITDDSPNKSEANPRVWTCFDTTCPSWSFFSLSGRGPVGWVHQEDQGWSNGCGSQTGHSLQCTLPERTANAPEKWMVGKLPFWETLISGTMLVLTRDEYCWWKKSCTTWHVWNPVNTGISTMSTGAGFLPSTVSNNGWFNSTT